MSSSTKSEMHCQMMNPHAYQSVKTDRSEEHRSETQETGLSFSGNYIYKFPSVLGLLTK